jgi:hypothetical protein
MSSRINIAAIARDKPPSSCNAWGYSTLEEENVCLTDLDVKSWEVLSYLLSIADEMLTLCGKT